ncbi:MAG: right-handed parallel beta-helix repeat-containing protein [Dehalococcoidia bacterium]|nr:hypothetical protein [Chloroflexi bacterium CFX7]MCK6565020.1 right-handed parallel beta-helix repeat-containing protein [Dehalococcoidia bacterium]NUQ55239.1 right-handed parallel beta-helix repeat-containing protein [Dehalococcoidia bacterium]RIL02664.1 MAG: hypothetical protein DCC78_06365 [bacterium]
MPAFPLPLPVRVVLLTGLCLLLPAARLYAPARAAGPDAVLTVNSLEDTDLPDSVLTLREAILIATGALTIDISPEEQAQTQGCTYSGAGNITGGCGAGKTELIQFAPSLGVSPVIVLAAPLPVINDTAALTINGGAVLPIIDAAAAGADTDGLVITSPGNNISLVTVTGAPRDAFSVAGNGNVLFGIGARSSGRHGVLIGSGTGNQVQYSSIGVATSADTACTVGNGGSGVYIGASVTAATVAGSVIGCNAGDGVTIDGADENVLHTNHIGLSSTGVALANGYGVALFAAATGNQVGPGPAGEANVIGGNTSAGVYIVGAGTTANTVIGNIIGLKPGGEVAAPNGGPGVEISTGAGANTVRSNVISGNGAQGVLVAGVAGTVIAGNRIGTNGLGSAAVPNGAEGVTLQSGATGTTVGGAGAADRNLISGNKNAGVVIRDAATSNNLIEGNNIGLDASGAVKIPNGQAGVAIFEGSDNRVGGDGSLILQFISGNTREGVYIESAPGTKIGRSTSIGTGFNTSIAIGNTREGVLVSDSTGVVARPGIVAGNGLAGMAVVGSSASGNTLAPYLSGANGGLPVDLGNDGATANDAGDADTGPNGLLNYPTITSRTGGMVSGTACTDCSVLVYISYADPAASGGKAEYLTRVQAGGSGAWSATIPAGVPLSNISAMACTGACTPGSATSELAPVTVAAQVRTIEFAVSASTAQEGGSVQLQVRLTTSDGLPTASGATVQYSTVNGSATGGSDFTHAAGTLSFLGGTASGETRTITISTLADSADDAGETFTVTLTSAGNARLGSLSTHTVTIGPPGSGLPYRVFVPLVARD